MATISGGSFLNTYGIKNNGIGGLASGLNTDEIVESLVSGTRSKIAKQNQQRQTLLWQQAAYRNVRTTLNAFKEKNFSYSGSKNGVSNIGAPGFFNTFKGTSSNDKVSFLPGQSTSTGTVTIDEVVSLSSQEKITIKQKFEPTVQGEIDPSEGFFGKTLNIRMDNSTLTKQIKLDGLDGIDDPGDFEAALQNLINKEIGTKSGGENIVTVKVDKTDGKMNIDLSSATNTVRIMDDCKSLGLKKDMSNTMNMHTSIGDMFGVTGDNLSFKVNGKLINVSSTDSVNTLMTKINSSASGVKMSYNSLSKQFSFTASAAGAGSNIKFEDVTGNLMNSLVGAKGSTVMTSSKIDGLKTTYDSSIVGQSDFKVSDFLDGALSGKDLSFKLDIGAGGKTIKIDRPDPSDIQTDENNVKTYKNTAGEYVSAEKWMEEKINEKLEEELPGEGIKISISEANSDGKSTVSLKTPSGKEVKFVADDPADPDSFSTRLIGDSNVSTDNRTRMSDLLDGATPSSHTFKLLDSSEPPNYKTVDWKENWTVDEFLTELNAVFGASDGSFASISNGQIVLNAGDYELAFQDDGTDGNIILEKLFGTGSYDGKSDDISNYAEHTKGSNAEIIIDGQKITSSSNVFVIDGVAFEVTDVVTDPITITSKSDPDELVDKITEFVDEYNALVKTLNSLVNEAKSKGYSPLTDEQKAEMTSDQIKSWETEAKKGLLRNDSTVREVISDLRLTINQKVEAAGLSLYDIGIEISSYTSSGNSNYDYDKAGTLSINETRLRKAIEENPEGVKILFTHNPDGDDVKSKDKGLAYALTDVINKATDASSVPEKRGTLVRMAGIDGSVNNTFDIGKKVDNLDEYIVRLKTKMESEYNRHWKKFSSLETAISRMNNQSSWLSSFGG